MKFTLSDSTIGLIEELGISQQEELAEQLYVSKKQFLHMKVTRLILRLVFYRTSPRR